MRAKEIMSLRLRFRFEEDGRSVDTRVNFFQAGHLATLFDRAGEFIVRSSVAWGTDDYRLFCIARKDGGVPQIRRGKIIHIYQHGFFLNYLGLERPDRGAAQFLRALREAGAEFEEGLSRLIR